MSSPAFASRCAEQALALAAQAQALAELAAQPVSVGGGFTSHPSQAATAHLSRARDALQALLFELASLDAKRELAE